MEWWQSLSAVEQTLIVSAGVLAVAVLTLIETWRGNRRSAKEQSELIRLAGEQLALERGRSDVEVGHHEEYRPAFELEVEPARSSDTNPWLTVTCTEGTLSYAVDAELLVEFDRGPAAIALIGDEAEYLGDTTGKPGVYKRYSLGTFTKGQSRMYSVQPDPGILHRSDDRASIRLIATAVDGAPAGSAWQSTYLIRVQYEVR